MAASGSIVCVRHTCAAAGLPIAAAGLAAPSCYAAQLIVIACQQSRRLNACASLAVKQSAMQLQDG